MAAGALAVTGTLTMGAGGLVAWAAETDTTTPAATRMDPLPRGAAVHRPGPAAGRKLALIEARQRKAAARAAAARKAREARAASERASRSRATYDGDPRGIAASIAAQRYGWGSGQFSCLDALWSRESGWDPYASNPSSGAYGIPQALPASKMSAYGADWRTNPVTQIQWGLAYIRDSYATPCGAWSAFRSQGWY